MISLGVVLVIALVCVSIEAFFSGSEIAMVSASRAKLRARAEAGSRSAKLAEEYLGAPELLLATTLLGTNLAVVTFSVTVSVFLVQGGYSGGELLAVITVTPFTLLFGEVIPKMFFQQRADELVSKLIYPLHWASLFMRPIIWLISGYARFVARIFGSAGQRTLVTRQELSLLLEADSDTEAISAEEREMISNLLEMSDDRVENIMLPLSEVTALPQEMSCADAIAVVADKGHSRMPVYQDRVDNIVGVLHVFDMLMLSTEERNSPIKSLSRQAQYVPGSFMASDMLSELQGSGNPMAIVVDEYGGAVGVVTVEDLLEEIVGEIEDEHDESSSQICLLRPGVWVIGARTSVERINDELRLNLPEDDEYESLGGLLLHRLRRLPKEGESLVVGDLTLRITKASDRAIDEVQVLRNRMR
ncbi:MAG: HlyC/CorC family transporter [Kofleriaceae bacterium]|nr:HlyC/CorC family transporter [Kofleriaceae bacterium]